MGELRGVRTLDIVLLLGMGVGAVLGVLGAACGGLTGDKGDHMEVANTQCVACHQKDYDATTKPPHADAKFPTTCGQCHTQQAWSPAKFIHPFPLIGAHAEKATCRDCHGDPPKYNLPTNCYGCHQNDYSCATGALTGDYCAGGNPGKNQLTMVPGHDGYPHTCDDCHNALAWIPASPVKHPYPLTGKHLTIDCVLCHTKAPGSYNNTPTECVGCHKQDYDASPFPGHQSFPTTCQDCHSTFAFKPATEFKHQWPLLGAHAKADCLACHKGNPPVYKGTSTLCYSCHAADFASNTDPWHQKNPHTCEDCHSTIAWIPAANFTHPWPLTGAHQATDCVKCHVNAPSSYANTPQDCWSCHQADYNSSPYPGHQTFQHTCTDCHTTTAWVPATGAGHPDNLFPISSGSHAPFACAECHNAALGANTKGANTDCVGCHTGQHTRAKMDPKHKGIKNYPTGTAPPNFCLDCHPKGQNNN